MNEEIQRLKEEGEQLKRRLSLIENFISNLSFSDRYVFTKNLQLLDGRNIQLGLGNAESRGGTMIGTSASQKLAFFGKVTTVSQPADIAAPTGGSVIDVEARAKFASYRGTLQDLGLIAGG